jgi:uncharacterized protein (DUF1810 family)
MGGGRVAMNDPFDLKRFLDAQEPEYSTVLSELRAGRKRSHWIWYIFPQLRGLGSSSMAQVYAIASIEEAQAYLKHPVLGPRLEECTALVNRVEGHAIDEIFGFPDNLKFRSSMTLFARAAEDSAPYKAALEKYFGGVPDPVTMNLLRQNE